MSPTCYRIDRGVSRKIGRIFRAIHHTMIKIKYVLTVIRWWHILFNCANCPVWDCWLLVVGVVWEGMVGVLKGWRFRS